MSPIITHLPILILEAHNRCNCRCVMCDIWKRTESQELTESELTRHLEDIERLGVEWVVFTGGEPLMNPGLFRLAAMLRARGIRITLLSTGLLLERQAARVVEHMDEVIVSLDGPRTVHDQIRRVPGAFDSLARGAMAIRTLSPRFPIAARCTVQSANAARLRETVAAARAIRLNSISFLATDLTSTAFNHVEGWADARRAPVAPELRALEDEIDALIADYPKDGFVLESPAKLRRIAAHFRAHTGLQEPVAPRCNAPWVSAVLETNGDVRPCFFHAPIGNTAAGTVAQILNGPAAIAFRQSLNIENDPICKRCVCSLYRPESSRIASLRSA